MLWEYLAGGIQDLNWQQYNWHYICATVEVFAKAFSSMILCLKKRGLFSSYCPIQEEWLAPGALEKLLYTYSARPSPLYIALFRSVELESHHLLFTVTVLTSPLPRALNLDLFSRKYSGVTYSIEKNEPTRIVCHFFCHTKCLLFFGYAVAFREKCHFFLESDLPLQW